VDNTADGSGKWERKLLIYPNVNAAILPALPARFVRKVAVLGHAALKTGLRALTSRTKPEDRDVS
jgi:hypothetical protein